MFFQNEEERPRSVYLIVHHCLNPLLDSLTVRLVYYC